MATATWTAIRAAQRSLLSEKIVKLDALATELDDAGLYENSKDTRALIYQLRETVKLIDASANR